MANLVDSFLGGFSRAAGYGDRRRQVQSQIQAQDIAAANFNLQQQDRAFLELGGRMSDSLTGLSRDIKNNASEIQGRIGVDAYNQLAAKSLNDYDIADFEAVYGKEGTKDKLNYTGFGASILSDFNNEGANKFITDYEVLEDGRVKVQVGTYDEDKGYVYGEGLTKRGKKAADGGEYVTFSADSINAGFRDYHMGVRRAANMAPELGEMAGFNLVRPGDRQGNENRLNEYDNNQGSEGTSPEVVEGKGFGITYTDPNLDGSTQSYEEGAEPQIQNIPMEDDLYAMLPKMEAGDPQVGAFEGLTGGETEFLSEDSLKAAGIGPDYIEHNLNLPFNMTQEQFDSLEDWQQRSVVNAAKRLNSRNIKARVKKILKPEGSSAVIGGGVLSDVRADSMNYVDGKKRSRAGLSKQERNDIDNANDFYHNREDTIYDTFVNSPHLFEEFEKDPIAFAKKYGGEKPPANWDKPGYNPQNPESKRKALNSSKGVDLNNPSPTTSEQGINDAAQIISSSVIGNTGVSDMSGLSRVARENIGLAIQGSLNQPDRATFRDQISTFIETGLFDLDPQRVALQQANAQTQRMFANQSSSEANSFFSNFNNLLHGGSQKDGDQYEVIEALSIDDLLKTEIPKLSQRMQNPGNTANFGLYASNAAAFLNKWGQEKSGEGLIGRILSWGIFNGSPTEGGFTVNPTLRAYTKDGKIATNAEEVAWIKWIDENNNQVGRQISAGEALTDLDKQGLNILLSFSKGAESIKAGT